MAKQQLIIEEVGKDQFTVRPDVLTIHSGATGEDPSELWVRPGETIELVVVSQTGEGASLWLLPKGHRAPGIKSEDFVHEFNSGEQRIDIEAQARTVTIHRMSLGPSEKARYFLSASKKGLGPDEDRPTGEGQAGSMNTSPG